MFRMLFGAGWLLLAALLISPAARAASKEAPVLTIYEALTKAGADPKVPEATFDSKKPLLTVRSVRAAVIPENGQGVVFRLNPDDEQKFAAITRRLNGGYLIYRFTDEILAIIHLSGPIEDGVIAFTRPEEKYIADYLVKRLKPKKVVAESGPAEKPLPGPEKGGPLNFTEIDQRKEALNGKVVKIEIQPRIIQTVPLGGGRYQAMLKDTATPQAFYGLVQMPGSALVSLKLLKKTVEEPLAVRELEARGLLGEPGEKPITLYVLVIFQGKKPAPRLIGLGRTFAEEDGKVRYAW